LIFLSFKLQTLSSVTGAPVAELIRRAIDAYLEQRKAEIKNARRESLPGSRWCDRLIAAGIRRAD
jgi:hypothetical protein